MNSTTDNFQWNAMFATKESVLSKFTDDELKQELKNRGWIPIWTRPDKDLIDADLGSGL